MNSPGKYAIALAVLIVAGALSWYIFKKEKASEIETRSKAVELSLASEALTHSNAPQFHVDMPMLRTLVDEMKMIGHLDLSSEDTWDRRFRLRKALEVLGTNALPVESEFRAEFNSGKNPVDAAWALIYIGDQEWPFLFQGLKSSSQSVQIVALSALAFAPPRYQPVAISNLLAFLTNQPDTLRINAAIALGELRSDPKTAIPALMTSLEKDTNEIVRIAALKSLERYGDQASVTTQDLLGVSTNDEDPVIRREAVRALKTFKGSDRPNK